MKESIAAGEPISPLLSQPPTPDRAPSHSPCIASPVSFPLLLCLLQTSLAPSLPFCHDLPLHCHLLSPSLFLTTPPSSLSISKNPAHLSKGGAASVETEKEEGGRAWRKPWRLGSHCSFSWPWRGGQYHVGRSYPVVWQWGMGWKRTGGKTSGGVGAEEKCYPNLNCQSFLWLLFFEQCSPGLFSGVVIPGMFLLSSLSCLPHMIELHN